jgi:toxin ParE1/3/4
MERKVSWTLPAVTNVENIRDYISLDSERYAFAFVKEIFDISQSLSILSERGRIVPELSEPSIRELFVKRYRLVYEVFTDKVEIVAVIHMSRDFSKVWNGRKIL